MNVIGRVTRFMKSIALVFLALLLQSCCVIGNQLDSEGSEILTETLNSVLLSPGNSTREVQINPGHTLTIELSNLTTPSISFGIIEVHSYFVDVTISYNETLVSGFYTKGTNIGLVIFGSESEQASSATTTRVFLTNDNSSNTSIAHVLLILQTYDSNAPIPGGCSMEESIQTAPFLPTQFTSSVITLKLPLASWPLNVRPPTCDKSPQQYDIYQYFLPENDRSMRTVFDSILLMSGVDKAEINGRKIEFNGSPASKIKLANYKGTGRIVVIVARALTSSAAYVPTLSYGCDPAGEDSEQTCSILVSTWAKLLVASLLFVGLFHTMVGHRFYKTHLFLHGLAVTGIVSYMALVLLVDLDSTVAELSTAALGTFGGALLVLVWCFFDVPVFVVFLSCLLVGFLFSSTVAFTPLADYEIMKSDTEFWLAFSSLVLVGPIVLISFTHSASIICTALVGSFLSIIIVDLFVGSNLKFIIFNVFHRATQSEFQTAVIDPPFQTPDLILAIIWALLALTGILFQLWREKDRPPFPNRPVWFTRRRVGTITVISESADMAPSEVTPLLYGSTHANNSYA